MTSVKIKKDEDFKTYFQFCFGGESSEGRNYYFPVSFVLESVE